MLEGLVNFRSNSVEESRNRLDDILLRIEFIIFLFGVSIVALLTVRRDSKYPQQFLNIAECFLPHNSIHVCDGEFLGVIDSNRNKNHNDFSQNIIVFTPARIMFEISVQNRISVFQIKMLLSALLYEFLEDVCATFVGAIDDNFFFDFNFSDFEDVLLFFFNHTTTWFIFFRFFKVDFFRVFTLFEQPKLSSDHRIVGFQGMNGIAGTVRFKVTICFLITAFFVSCWSWILQGYCEK